MEPDQWDLTDFDFRDRDLSPAEQQFREWLREPPADAIRVAQESLRDDYVSYRPTHYGQNVIIGVVVARDCDLSEHEDNVRERLGGIGWQWVTVKDEATNEPKPFGFGMAPIRRRPLHTAYHTTLRTAIPSIRQIGLLPSNKANRQTDYPDTEGRIHVSEKLEGDGSAVRWIRIFSEKYNRPQADYGILKLDLQGAEGRMYEDIHSAHGVVIDRTVGIEPCRIGPVPDSAYTLEQAGESCTSAQRFAISR